MRVRWPWRTRETFLIDLLDEAIRRATDEVHEARALTETVTEALEQGQSDRPD